MRTFPVSVRPRLAARRIGWALLFAIGTALVGTALVLASSPARAITIRLCECSLSEPTFDVGSTLTLGFRIEGDPGEEIYGLGLSVYGYNESVLDYVSGSGQAVSSIFHGVAIPGIGAFNGLTNTLASPLVETSVGSSGNRVLIFNGIGLAPVTHNPLDPGLDGVIGGGDAQIRVTFRATGLGYSSLVVDTGYPGDGVVIAGGQLDQSNSIVLTVIPGYGGPGSEPICPIPETSTALSLMLGLASLSWHGPRAT